MFYEWETQRFGILRGEKRLAGLCAFTVELTEDLGEERRTHSFFFMAEAEQRGSYSRHKNLLRVDVTKSTTESCATWLGMKIFPESQTLCEKNVEAIRGWLEDTSNTCCHKPRSSSTPSRLLDLGMSRYEDPRLILTTPANPSGKNTGLEYAALSYCWGSADEAALNLKTEKSTLESHIKGINAQKLPRALQDAVKV